MRRISKHLIIAASVALGPSAFADPTASISLGGEVEPSLAMTVLDTAIVELLDLSGGEKIVKVADIAMSTNNEQGLTLTVTSGSLTKTGGTAIPFQVSTVDDAASPPASGDFLVSSGTSYTVGSIDAGVLDVDLYIKYSPATLQDPGYYDGTIDLTVSDN